MTALASQKRLFGPFRLVTLVYSVWYLIFQPLTGFSLAFAVEPLTLMKGQVPGGLLFAAFQAMYVLSILSMFLITGYNEHYTNRTLLGLFNGLMASVLCGFFLAFTSMEGVTTMSRRSLDALAIGSVAFLAYLLLHAMLTGRLAGFRATGPLAVFIRSLRNNRFIVELISLAGIPALWLNAEVSRGLLQFPLQLIRRGLGSGRVGPNVEMGLVTLLFYGTLVYAVLVFPSRTIGVHTKEHKKLHRILQKKPPVLVPFFLSYLGYLATLFINTLYGFFLPG